jgi:O-antigen/teichoic acid export membrane protein
LTTGDHEAASAAFSTSTLLMISASVVLLLVGLLAASHVDRLFVVAPEYVDDARMMMAAVVVSSAIELSLISYSTCFFATQRFVLSNAIALFGDVLRFLLLAGLLFGIGPRVLWVAIAHAVATIVVSLARAIVGRRILPQLRFERVAVHLNLVPALISFGTQDLTVQMSKMLRGVTTIWILNRFAASVDVASFHVGQSVYRQVMQAWVPVRGALSPPLVAMSARGEHSRLRQVYYRGGRLGLWLTMAVATPLIVFSDEIIRLFAGETYMLAAGVMSLLLLRLPLEMVNNLFPLIARARGDMKRLAQATLAIEITGVTAVLASVAVLDYGAVGASAASMAVTLVGEALIIWPLALRYTGGSRADSWRKAILPGLGPAVAGSAVWWISSVLFEPASWSAICIAAVPGMLVYVGAVAALMFPEDRSDISKFAARIRSGGFARHR